MSDASTQNLVTLRAPVKVNLHLGIHPGRDDRGYHRADSVMIALALGDIVRVGNLSDGVDLAREAKGVQLRMSEDVGIPFHKNTAWLAASRLRETLRRDDRVVVSVEKSVLPKSGLGGSSSDAASVLIALSRRWGVDPTSETVVSVARSVGADVPFFLDPAPSYLSGAGDVLTESFPALANVPVVLVRPSEGVSTAAAYAAFDEAPTTPPSPDAMCAALRAGDLAAVADNLYNNLGPVACRLVPDDEMIMAWLGAEPGVLATQVCGSGSCVFAASRRTTPPPSSSSSGSAEMIWRRREP
jgi:4-diphosphocytidyl-2-C-methyl-D-erythritol kinase